MVEKLHSCEYSATDKVPLAFWEVHNYQRYLYSFLLYPSIELDVPDRSLRLYSDAEVTTHIVNHFVSMLHCNWELPSLRPMETTKFNMMWSCFTSREMLCIEILCASWQHRIRMCHVTIHVTVLLLSNVMPYKMIQTHVLFVTHRNMFPSNYIETHISRFGAGNSQLHRRMDAQ